MMKDYDSIQLFKRKRETDEAVNTDQEVPELIISPLDPKEKEKGISSLTNNEKPSLPPEILNLLQKAFTALGVTLKDSFLQHSLKDKDGIQKWPIWSVFKKPE